MRSGRAPGRVIIWVAIVLAVLGILTAIGLAYHADKRSKAAAVAAEDAPFYLPPSELPADPGVLIRVEPMTAGGSALSVPGARAWRMLYTSTRPDGVIVAASGMVFVPTQAPPPNGRPLLAWAHGTIGMGAECAPSRSANPVGPIATWLPVALQSGWMVVAPDYAGLGTPGHELYLIGRSEAADVAFAVQAARQIPDTDPGSLWAVMGHSQGGHAALWTGNLGPAMAPGLDLVGVAALAPAAELPLIINAQWDTSVSWVIGPEVQESWPRVDERLGDSALSPQGQARTSALAMACVTDAAVEALVRQGIGQRYYERNPLDDPAWQQMAEEQVPSPLHPDLPVYLGQSTADTVVLAWPNATLQRQWCSAGSNVTAAWINNVSHMKTGLVMGPGAVEWLTARRDGEPTQGTCTTEPPVSPPPDQAG